MYSSDPFMQRNPGTITIMFHAPLPPESDNLHEDVRQGRIPDERKEVDRDEKNPPSNGRYMCVPR